VTSGSRTPASTRSHAICSYLREFQALGTAGGLYHFRDAILKGSPEQIFVLHADIACSYPLAELKAFHDHHRGVGTIMGVKVPRESASKYGCIVTSPETKMAMHYVEKPESFISDIINGGIYLFDKAIFDEIRAAMDEKLRKNSCACRCALWQVKSPHGAHSEDPLATNDELRLEQDVIAPLASARRLYVYETPSFWRQIKTGGCAALGRMRLKG
jgi:mannose-1-phosphate guanylyltransferase